MIQPSEFSKGISIGTLQIAHPFIQAALSGYSDLAMRRVARRHGADYCVNEVVLDKSVLHDGPWQRRLLTVEPDDHPVGGQLMGGNPVTFGPAANRMVEAGYDVIDINFGCPAPSAENRCRGGFLLSDPATATEIIRRVVDAVGGRRPVTLKMRRGLDHSDSSERDFFAIFDMAFDTGVDAVTVHGRSVEQRYRGHSDWDFLARLKKYAGERTILGSGDLFTAEDCVRMMSHSGVDGVTIARGALGNPWIFDRCKALAAMNETTDGSPMEGPTIEQQLTALRMHLDELAKIHGPEKGAKLMQKFGMCYAARHPKRKRVRQALGTVRTREQFFEVLREWYQNYAAESTG